MRADLSCDLSEGCLNRHAGFHADQAKIESVRPGHGDGKLTGSLLLVDVDNWKVKAETAEHGDSHQFLHEGEFEITEQKDVDGADHHQGKRQNEPQGQKDKEWRLPAIARLDERFGRFLVRQSGAQIEFFNEVFHRLTRFLPGHTFAVAFFSGQTSPFPSANLLPLKCHRFHPPVELVAVKHGQNDREHGRHNPDDNGRGHDVFGADKEAE